MKARVMAQMGTLGSCCNVQLQFCPFSSEHCRVATESGETAFAQPALLVCPCVLFSALGKFRCTFSGWGSLLVALPWPLGTLLAAWCSS